MSRITSTDRRRLAAVLVSLWLASAAQAQTAEPPITITDMIEAKRIAAPSAVAIRTPADPRLPVASGVVVDTSRGRRILTTARAVLKPDGSLYTAANEIQAEFYRSGERQQARGQWMRIVLLPNGARALDMATNLALLEPSLDSSLPSDAVALPFRAVNAPLDIGEILVVIGTQNGFAHSVTDGSLAYLGRRIEAYRYLQHDAPCNPGCYGGPVYSVRKDAAGNLLVELIGINARAVEAFDSRRHFVGNANGLTFAHRLETIVTLLRDRWSVIR